METGFSIREYVSTMRSVNVVKCWPFSKEEEEEEEESVVKSMLPPITVKKFIWWLDELEHLQSKSKKKNKSPKKRSILEIFAVAPELERVISSEADFGISWAVKGKRNCTKMTMKKKKMKDNKEIILSKAMKVIKKKKKKKISPDLIVPHKKNCSIFALRDDQDRAIGNQSSSNKRDSKKDSCYKLPIHKKKPRLERLDSDKKKVTRKAITFISGHPKNPTHGILKSHNKTFSLKEDKYATSIQKDDVLGRNFGGVFVGLPLNSQGELITFSSSAHPKSWDYRTTSNKQMNMFPVEKGYLKENPLVFDRSKLGTSIQSQSSGKTILDYVENSLCKKDNGVHKNHGNEKIQSTLRLMGKELKVGGTGFEGSEDGHLWKDKHIIDQSMYSFPIFDHQSSSIYQNDFVPRTNPVEKLHPDFLSAVYRRECIVPKFSSNDVQLKNEQNLINGPKSSIRFPFMHPDLEGQNWPPLFSEFYEKGTSEIKYQLYCKSGDNNHHPLETNRWAQYSSVFSKPAPFSSYIGSSSMGIQLRKRP